MIFQNIQIKEIIIFKLLLIINKHYLEGKEKTAFDSIKVENVNFSYEDEVILKEYSLEIPKNKITAIVGKSGSGKSTLLKLLSALLMPTSGKILIMTFSFT